MSQKFETMRMEVDAHVRQDLKHEALKLSCKEDEDASNYSSSSSPPSPISLDSFKLHERKCEKPPLPYLIQPSMEVAEDDGLDLYNEFVESCLDSDGLDTDEEDTENYIILDQTDSSSSDLNEPGLFMSFKSKIHGALAAKLGLKCYAETIDENRNVEIGEVNGRNDHQTGSKDSESCESDWELV